jgi:hypothetical protein
LNVIEVSSISGHMELRMLKRYTHLNAEDLISAEGEKTTHAILHLAVTKR